MKTMNAMLELKNEVMPASMIELWLVNLKADDM